ncbi:MAG TPA: DUF4142 domain-containing protein [Longimicrobium sp.]|nr:DUF4142 domain-containing protein [Longimicrobium sp.]
MANGSGLNAAKGVLCAAFLLGGAAFATGSQKDAAVASQHDEAAHSVMLSVHVGEIEEGQLALQNAMDPQVRSFAEMLVRDHSAAMERQQTALNDDMDDWAFARALSAYRGLGLGGAAPSEQRAHGRTVIPGTAIEGVGQGTYLGGADQGKVGQEGQPARSQHDPTVPLNTTSPSRQHQQDRDARGLTGTADTQNEAAQVRAAQNNPGAAAPADERATGRTVIPGQGVEGVGQGTYLGGADAGQGSKPNEPARAQHDPTVPINTTSPSRQHQMDREAAGLEGSNRARAIMSTMPIERNMLMHPLANALMETRWSRPVVQSHVDAMVMLSGLSGRAFDMAYVNRQVAAHEYALASIDNLLPSVRSGGSPETAAMLEQMRGSVNNHLNMARQLRDRMSRM